MSWNLEKEEKLKKLWGKGNTASEIAQIIGGVTRNAVIGKAHRLNLATKSGIHKVKKSKEKLLIIQMLFVILPMATFVFSRSNAIFASSF